MDIPYLLIETASFHAGDRRLLAAVIERLSRSEYGGKRGIKFHPIAPEALANPDFYAFPIYKEIAFDKPAWTAIIEHAAAHFEVWLEMADRNCAEVLAENRDRITGLKFQASMVDNVEVLERLKECRAGELLVFLNISGLSLHEIEDCLARFERYGLARRNIALQIGFQGYPTAIADTMLNKIAILRKAFPDHALSFADHVDATDSFALVVPVLAVSLGCSFVEKHICLSRDTTRFDKYSALEPEEMIDLQVKLEKTAAAFSRNFVCPAEARYLKDSKLQPCLKHPLAAGQLVSPGDVLFRRQGTQVLGLAEISGEQARRRVLVRDHAEREGVTYASFRDAKVSVVVACRMKSTRLPDKPFVRLNNKIALERCLENCLAFPGVGSVVLATSTHPDDAALSDSTLGGRVGFYRGAPDDVLRRYLDVAERDGIDIIVRVTADCPVVSPEIAAFLLDSHFAAGADFTRAKEDAVGTGSHIINVEAMRRVDRLLGGAPLSEYMNWYFESNPDRFKINIVDLPPDLVRTYRLTLDYPADRDMFDELFRHLDEAGLPATAGNVFSILDARPDIVALNSAQTLVYKTDLQLIDKLRRETRIPPVGR